MALLNIDERDIAVDPSVLEELQIAHDLKEKNLIGKEEYQQVRKKILKK